MDSDRSTVQQLFKPERQFCVPLYQRAYVWNRQNQWSRLWADTQEKAEARLAGLPATPFRPTSPKRWHNASGWRRKDDRARRIVYRGASSGVGGCGAFACDTSESRRPRLAARRRVRATTCSDIEIGPLAEIKNPYPS